MFRDFVVKFYEYPLVTHQDDYSLYVMIGTEYSYVWSTSHMHSDDSVQTLRDACFLFIVVLLLNWNQTKKFDCSSPDMTSSLFLLSQMSLIFTLSPICLAIIIRFWGIYNEMSGSGVVIHHTLDMHEPML